MTSSGRRTFFANNFWYKWARDVGFVSQRSSRQGASPDMQYDLLRSHCDLHLAWPEVKFWNWPFKDKKHMDGSGLTMGTRWCQACSPSLSSLEVIHEKYYPKIFLSLMTSHKYSIRVTANLRTQSDSGDPGLSFGYLTILLASIVIEIIAIFCEIARFWENLTFLTPCDLKCDLNKIWSKYLCRTCHGLSNAVYRLSLSFLVFELSGGWGRSSAPGRAKVAQTPGRARDIIPSYVHKAPECYDLQTIHTRWWSEVKVVKTFGLLCGKFRDWLRNRACWPQQLT